MNLDTRKILFKSLKIGLIICACLCFAYPVMHLFDSWNIEMANFCKDFTNFESLVALLLFLILIWHD